MKYTNKSKFDSGLILDIFNWGRKRLSLRQPVEVLRVYDYSGVRQRTQWRGTAFPQKRQIIARVKRTEAGYPMLRHQYPGQPNAPRFDLMDCFDSLAYVLIHELGHFKDWQANPWGTPPARGSKQWGPWAARKRELRRGCETRVETLIYPIIQEFQDNRAKLVYRWGRKLCYPPVVPRRDDPRNWVLAPNFIGKRPLAVRRLTGKIISTEGVDKTVYA